MNAKEIRKRQGEFSKEIMKELGNSKSPRVEILLLTNSIESVLKDFVEFLLQTEEARSISREIIVNILETRKSIPTDLAHDVRMIFKIRDAYAHRLSLNQINEIVEKQILPNMKCVQNVLIPNVPKWKERDLTRKILDVADGTFVHLIMHFDLMTKEPVRVRIQREGKSK